MANKPEVLTFSGCSVRIPVQRQTIFRKDPSRGRSIDLPGKLCMTLLHPYFKKGYNVTTDNYFTSLKLAEEFKQRKTTILGTIRKQRREMPNTDLVMKDKSLHTSEIYSSPSGCSLAIYKAKKKKVGCSLSSMHRNVTIHQATKRNCQRRYIITTNSKWVSTHWTRWLDTIPARAPVNGGRWLCFQHP